MNGLLRRLTRRRAATADEHPPETPAASEPVDATVVSLDDGSSLSGEERLREDELRRQRRDLPAGLDPAEFESVADDSARRGALRRRVRYLRAAREVLLRDLGGFYYEVHRTAGTAPNAAHRTLLEHKAGRLSAVDEELRQLVTRLGVEPGTTTIVREPGVGGACRVCGELHGSDAGWCAHCGEPLTDGARKRNEQAVDDTIAARHAAAQEAEAERVRAAEAAAQPAAVEADKPDYAATHKPDAAAAADPAAGESDKPDAAATTVPAAASDNGAAARGDAPTSEMPAETDPVGEPRR